MAAAIRSGTPGYIGVIAYDGLASPRAREPAPSANSRS